MPTLPQSVRVLVLLLAASVLCSSVSALTIEIGGGGGTLVSTGDTWAYFKGTTNPSTPTDAWRQVGFDDSSWLTGPGGFGYGDGDDATELSDMEMTGQQPGYASVFIRREFDVATVPAGTLELVVDYDDGFVAYINGAEVARSSNMPSGTPTFSTEADGNHEAGTPETFILGNAADFLTTGTNVLAISGHNTSLGSSDFSLIPTLRIASGIVQNGNAWIIGNGAPALTGTVMSGAAESVTIDGIPANYDSDTQQWDGAPSLGAGLNTVLVEARDAAMNVVESETIEIIYVPPANEISGTVAASATK